MTLLQTDSSPAQPGESLPADTLQTDTLENTAVEHTYGIVLTPPENFQPQQRNESGGGLSFITGALFLVFFLVCFRFHNNRKFLSGLGRNLMEVKERSNMFDDTVRETSFLLLLNLLWCVAAGVILFRLIEAVSFARGLLPPVVSPAAGMGICIAVAVGYSCFMAAACMSVGTVFSDTLHANLWLKGFTASQGILGFFYFPVALAFLCYPELDILLLWIAGIMFILARFFFILKGFRIFFTQSSSWVLFLYYLCSLEIVPLILSYIAAAFLCRL